MRFTLLYGYDPDEAGPTEAEVQDWLKFDEDVKAAGAHVYEAGFNPVSEARTVSVREGRVITQQGPASGGGHAVAGVWTVDVADADAAVAWARRLPTAKYGTVEVRPVVEYG